MWVYIPVGWLQAYWFLHMGIGSYILWRGFWYFLKSPDFDWPEDEDELRPK